jgi:hypothetical protein
MKKQLLFIGLLMGSLLIFATSCNLFSGNESDGTDDDSNPTTQVQDDDEMVPSDKPKVSSISLGDNGTPMDEPMKVDSVLVTIFLEDAWPNANAPSSVSFSDIKIVESGEPTLVNFSLNDIILVPNMEKKVIAGTFLPPNDNFKRSSDGYTMDVQIDSYSYDDESVSVDE